MTCNIANIRRSPLSCCFSALLALVVSTAIGAMFSLWLYNNVTSLDVTARICGSAIFLGLVLTAMTIVAQCIASRLWLSAGLVAITLTTWISLAAAPGHYFDVITLVALFVWAYVYAIIVGGVYTQFFRSYSKMN